jgi:hypothetical protein
MDNIAGIPCENVKPNWHSSVPHPDTQLARNKAFGLVSEYKDYVPDPRLGELVAGKSVAYVCPSPHLMGKGMGEYIDSYDVVVRVNQNFTPTEDTWEDYGKRTDILVNCINVNKIRALSDNPDYVQSLKYILCPMVSVTEKASMDAFLESTNVPFQNVCDGHVFKMFREIGTTANTGLTGILTLLNYPLKSLYVTGMTFFNMNKMGRIYHDKYHDEAVKYGNFSDTEDKAPSVAQLRMDIHEQQPQIDYFRKVVNIHYPKTLKLDEFLMENFAQ